MLTTAFLLLTCMACTAQPELFDYDVTFSTPSGNKIWVQKIVFDNRWTTPAGSMACCWEEAGKGSYISKTALPKIIYIRWIQEKQKRIYSATVQLRDNLPELAKSLPGFTVKRSGRKDPGSIYIITGMKPDGSVIVWLSNAPYKDSVAGRVLHVIGQAQATSEPWIKPGKQQIKI